MSKEEIDLLNEEIQLLNSARDALEFSYDICIKIGIKKDYTYDELDRFEALTSRFARLSDILIQKVFRLIDFLDLEDSESVRDRINRAEKINLIESSDIFIRIRILRNEIAHEYTPEAVKDIFKKVLEYTPKLFYSVEMVNKYIKKYENFS